jgi:plasmid maintenance system antidote protein VapI
MFYQQNHVLAHDVDEHDITQLQAQEVQVMTPGTPFAVLAERCGLSQREAAEFLKVRIDTIKSWCAGRNVAKPNVLAELRELYAKIQAAADKLAQDNERLLEQQRERKIQQRAIVFGLAETDDVARAYGFPSQGPYMAAIGLALLRLPDDVAIAMESQSYPGVGGGGAAPLVPGTTLIWPPSRKASPRMSIQAKERAELLDLVTQAVKKSGKCSDLAKIGIIGPVSRGVSNWDVSTMSTQPPNTISDACRNELAAIVGRLQQQYSLAKDKKTAHELESIIGQRIGVGGVMVSVYPDPAFGWNATLITAPSAAIGAQPMLEQIAQELRTEFDLKP